MTRRARSPLDARAQEIYVQDRQANFVERDRLFAKLFVAQWIFAVVIALWWSPRAWQGRESTLHPHVVYALVVGALLTLPPIAFIVRWPGATVTRHFIAVCQMLWSALLIHLTGGRIESHFHIFGSLAFIAYYRDWRLLLTATAAVVADHLARGLYWSESVYGIANPEWWRLLEHAAWMVFEDTVLLFGIVESHREMRALAARRADLERANHDVEAKVVERTRELLQSREEYRQIAESTRAIPFTLDVAQGAFSYIGPQAPERLGFSEAELRSPGILERLLPRTRERAAREQLESGEAAAFEVECRVSTGDARLLDLRFIASRDGQDAAAPLRGLILDLTEQRRLERDLAQAQKLESVGRLASGVAHEINTPVQFVCDSVHFVREGLRDLEAYAGACRELQRAASSGGEGLAAAAAAARAAEEAADLDYLLAQAPPALDRALEGLARVASIVQSMKVFAHPDGREKAHVSLNQAVESTLVIARNEYKYVADVRTELGELPAVLCHAGEINQVLLNLIVNAAHAIGDVVRGSERRGTITIRTRRVGDLAEIAIGDTGTGIPEAARAHVFDPFFTTKEVGKGSGQGLSIARSVIVDKHGGSIDFTTELGQGTTFYVRLPLAEKARAAA